MNVEMTVALIEKILRFGVPAVVKTIQAWDIDDVTIEDIQGLKVKSPEEYFEDTDSS